MARIKLTTDSAADIPAALAGELGANIAALQQVMAKIRATLDDSTHFLKQLDLPAADDAE